MVGLRNVHQHRLTLHSAVLKLNAPRAPLADAPTGLAGLRCRSVTSWPTTRRSSPPVSRRTAARAPRRGRGHLLRTDADGDWLELSQRASLTGPPGATRGRSADRQRSPHVVRPHPEPDPTCSWARATATCAPRRDGRAVMARNPLRPVDLRPVAERLG
jgi:hypothetical protein